jgi:hypothetical protein
MAGPGIVNSNHIASLGAVVTLERAFGFNFACQSKLVSILDMYVMVSVTLSSSHWEIYRTVVTNVIRENNGLTNFTFLLLTKPTNIQPKPVYIGYMGVLFPMMGVSYNSARHKPEPTVMASVVRRELAESNLFDMSIVYLWFGANIRCRDAVEIILRNGTPDDATGSSPGIESQYMVGFVARDLRNGNLPIFRRCDDMPGCHVTIIIGCITVHSTDPFGLMVGANRLAPFLGGNLK